MKDSALRTQPHSVAVVDRVEGVVVLWTVDVGREPRATGAWVLDVDDHVVLAGLLRDRWLLPLRFDPTIASSRGVINPGELSRRAIAELKPEEDPARYEPPTLGELLATNCGDPRTAAALGMARWLERSAFAWYDGRRKRVPLLPVAECLQVQA